MDTEIWNEETISEFVQNASDELDLVYNRLQEDPNSRESDEVFSAFMSAHEILYELGVSMFEFPDMDEKHDKIYDIVGPTRMGQWVLEWLNLKDEKMRTSIVEKQNNLKRITSRIKKQRKMK